VENIGWLTRRLDGPFTNSIKDLADKQLIIADACRDSPLDEWSNGGNKPEFLGAPKQSKHTCYVKARSQCGTPPLPFVDTDSRNLSLQSQFDDGGLSFPQG
jgi:hypothetical protein